ncbi:MAG TPA: hypothetical protein PL048_18475 [Leptospiraceae bacterium]|nr:hypothetical protein [Leptospiraceae bacterium]HMY65175.1 hypothetical protein [Leptospiraceae bacterium]HMZ60768.1 hypothetical protein [Leptospiraceae bacterium]HNF16266.1 hypothetical protein [Leptospiraceae bacterium]HNF26583.1 hypothetical protein [Leptospiraceae bacterium]
MIKNYLCKFNFNSRFFETHFYRQIRAMDEKEALIDIVSFFLNAPVLNAIQFLDKNLGFGWTPENFWNEMELTFHSDDESESYRLLYVKELGFDLDGIFVGNESSANLFSFKKM